MNATTQLAMAVEKYINSPHRKIGVRGLCRFNPHLAAGAIAVCLLAVFCTGCISTGETIRVSGVVVDANGQRVADAEVLADATKRGGTLISRDEIANPDLEDEARASVVDLPGDGSFNVTSRWSGTLTLSVQGYKIRRVDDLGTVFLVPNRSFFKSQNQVRLEVVKDE